jgi:uncharacterized cupredoxin-like copper-binding protein
LTPPDRSLNGASSRGAGVASVGDMNHHRRTRRLVALPIAILLAVALPTVAGAAKTTTVAVKMTDFKVAPSLKSAKPGKVTFAVKNAAKMEHEIVVIKTKLAASKLPVKKGLASEKGAVGETGDLAGGKSKNLTLTLKAGHYALICNVIGHYQAGMRADFTVK